MCAGLCSTYWTTFGSPEKNRNNSCLLHEWDHPPFFEFLTPPPPAPRGRRTPDARGGRGMSADIVPRHITFRVDPSTRCWDIAQKPPKCKNSPLEIFVTINENFIFPFSAGRGLLTSKRGEDKSGTRVRPHAKFGLNRPAGCREIVDK